MRIEVEDGDSREFGIGDVMIEEDFSGKGHRAWSVGKEPIVHTVTYLT